MVSAGGAFFSFQFAEVVKNFNCEFWITNIPKVDQAHICHWEGGKGCSAALPWG